MMEQVILVDNDDRELGFMEKMKAHEEGILHRAFSVLIFNSNGEILLQQRAMHKYHSPGLWTNTCCSHPRPGEDIVPAALRRLKEEMGLSSDLKIDGSFIYHHQFDNGLTEHEYDYVLSGVSDAVPFINKEEAMSYKWISIDDLKNDIEKNADQYTFWFKELIKQNFLKLA